MFSVVERGGNQFCCKRVSDSILWMFLIERTSIVKCCNREAPFGLQHHPIFNAELRAEYTRTVVLFQDKGPVYSWKIGR